MKVTIATGMSNDPEVHRAGCADVARGLRSGKYIDTEDLEVEKVEDAALEWWSDIIAEYEGPAEAERQAIDHWTKFLPCTRQA